METTLSKTTVLGRALYLEFRQGEFTAQVVLMPECVIGLQFKGMRVMRRTISALHPRKSWRFSSVDSATREAHKTRVDLSTGTGVMIPVENLDMAKGYAQENLKFVGSILQQLHHQSWVLEKQPIAVDFSYEDFLDAEAGKTPAALVRRINRSRAAFGFSEDLFAKA
jgi:hypothetical protein